jgi:hypothetical protein
VVLSGIGVDTWFSRTVGSATSYSETDVLGSTIALADPTGSVSTAYTYDPYGNGGTGSGTNPFQFMGRENDSTGSLSL